MSEINKIPTPQEMRKETINQNESTWKPRIDTLNNVEKLDYEIIFYDLSLFQAVDKILSEQHNYTGTCHLLLHPDLDPTQIPGRLSEIKKDLMSLENLSYVPAKTFLSLIYITNKYFPEYLEHLIIDIDPNIFLQDFEDTDLNEHFLLVISSVILSNFDSHGILVQNDWVAMLLRIAIQNSDNFSYQMKEMAAIAIVTYSIAVTVTISESPVLTLFENSLIEFLLEIMEGEDQYIIEISLTLLCLMRDHIRMCLNDEDFDDLAERIILIAFDHDFDEFADYFNSL